jgi:hypothetical protein
LILVSPEGEMRNAYAKAIDPIGVRYDTVATLQELYYAMEKVPYNGILIDLATKLKTPHEELNLVENILEKFPVIQLKWEDKTKVFRTYYPGQHKSGESLEDFVNKQCRFFDARKISIEKRVEANFSVLLSKDKDFREGHVERTITINVSDGGCYIFTAQKWDIRSKAWFIIKGLSDETPICGEVRWHFAWGCRDQTPGIGVKFQEIKESQIKELCSTRPLNERRKRRR